MAQGPAGADGKKAVSDDPKKPAGSLYDRLGGTPAITAVVHEFIGNVAADKRINNRFFNTDLPKLEKLLVELVCMTAGGPCKYSGQTMETSHAGMEVVHDEFVALVEDLVAALDKFKVPDKEKGEILGALGPLEPAIVTPPDRLKPVPAPAIANAKKVAATLKDAEAKDVMDAAIVAAERGQRNYADQLFSRVEILVGSKTVVAAAPTFRDGAPPRIDTPTTKMPKDTAPQPKVVGRASDDVPTIKGAASLKGQITVEGKPLEGVGFIMLYPAKGGFAKRTPKIRVVEQRDKQFSPRLLAVPPGSTVKFPNFDGIYHNVFSLSSTKKFDIGLYKDGETRELKFDKVGLVRLGCNIHARMASYIFVVDAPAYDVVEGDKGFDFVSIPAGKYKAKVWSDRSAQPIEKDIEVKPGANAMTFDVAADGETGPSEDKFGMTRQTAAK